MRSITSGSCSEAALDTWYELCRSASQRISISRLSIFAATIASAAAAAAAANVATRRWARFC
eukprot:6504095-Heterocapsa_arctica.AAC.1